MIASMGDIQREFVGQAAVPRAHLGRPLDVREDLPGAAVSGVARRRRVRVGDDIRRVVVGPGGDG